MLILMQQEVIRDRITLSLTFCYFNYNYDQHFDDDDVSKSRSSSHFKTLHDADSFDDHEVKMRVMLKEWGSEVRKTCSSIVLIIFRLLGCYIWRGSVATASNRGTV